MRALALLMLIMLTSTARADLRYPAELTLGYDSNIVNTRNGGVERESALLVLRGGLRDRQAFTSLLGFETRAELEGQQVFTEDRLSSLRASLAGRLFGRPSQSFYAPLLALDGQAAWSEFNSRARDSADARLAGFVLQPLTTRISARVTLDALWRNASAAAFSVSQQNIALDIDWRLSGSTASYAGYQRRIGDFVTTTPVVPAAAAARALAISADDVFPGESAVLQRGHADIFSLGFNWALSSTYSLDLLARHVDAESEIGVHYRRNQVFLSLLARY